MGIYVPGRETDDLSLVAALLTMGVEPDPLRPARTIEMAHAKAPKYVFYFKERSRCGKFETEKLIKVWNDDRWLAANENHPWAWLRRNAENYLKALWFVKNCPALTEQRLGGLVGFLSLNADQETQDRFFQKFERAHKKGRRTRGI